MALIKKFDEIFKIKYNSLSTGNSTYRLKPDKGFIVNGIIAFSVLGNYWL